LALQPDGKLVVGGSFATLSGQLYVGIGRLNTDGSLDTNFNPAGSEWSGVYGVTALALQRDGKVVVTGSTATGSRVERLNADGSLDASFNSVPVGADFGAAPEVLALQPDGKVVVGG